MRPWLVLGLALSVPPAAAAAQNATTETVEQALCRLVENAASEHRVPVDFFTRLIWQESTFRPGVTSRAGAQGIAQFMPQTARERGLADPFDPEQAIPKAAELLAELRQRFGNLGLATAAYNGGPNRVASWLAGEGELPAETRAYVAIVTRRSVDEWRPTESGGAAAEPMPDTGAPSPSCLEMTALLRRPGREAPEELTPFAPWGVQLAGNFSKERALATFDRARRRVAAVIEDERPMVIGTRLRYRGTRTFYRVRVPAQTRQAATVLCNRIRAAGGSCVVLPS